jgi:DHA1 family multidrug resistance protein-like MFS transporter
VSLTWRQTNFLFLATQSVQFLAEGHINAFTPLLLHDLGLAEAEVAVWTGLLFGVMMSVAMPLSPFWGVLAERYSRKLMIVRTYYFLTLALLIMAWAPNVWALVVGRIVMGLTFASGGVILGTQSLLTPPRYIGRAIATVQAAQPIAASIGPPVGALLIPGMGLRGLLLLDAAITLAAGIALTVRMPEPEGGRQRESSVLARTGEVIGLVWSRGPIRWNFISAGLLRGAQSVVDAYLPVRITQVAGDPLAATTAIGWILGTYGALTTAFTWLAGRVVERLEASRLFWQMMLFGTLVTVGLAAAPWIWLIGLLAALRSLPVAFGNTVLFAHKARILPRDLQTPIFSLAPLPRNIGAFAFPIAAAAVAGIAPGAALVVGALCYGGTWLAGVVMERETRKAA